MSRERDRGTGWKFVSFPCASDDADLLARVLDAHFGAFVEPGRTHYEGGRLKYSLELSAIGLGEGPAMEERIARTLHEARSRHRMPTLPPKP